MFSRSDEIKCQREALDLISHGNNSLAYDLCMYHNMIIAITFRGIINQFESNLDRCPTADELIWLTSEILKENIREIF